MNALQIIKSSNLMDIISLGGEISKSIQANSKKTTDIIDRALRQSDSSIVKSIDKIIAKVDIEELSNFSNRKTGIQGLIEKVKNTKNKIEEKYTSILKELGNIESSALMWQSDLKDINTMLQDSKLEYSNAISELLSLRELLFNEVDALSEVEQTPLNVEKKTVISQKINDINIKLQTLEQLSSAIDIAYKTNYNNYKIVMSVYDTTIPMIEAQLSIKSTANYHRMVAENVKYLHDKNNELIESTAKEIIKAGEEAIQLLGDTSNFEALKSAKKMIEEGKVMLATKEKEQVLKIQASLSQLQLEGGK